MGVFHCPVGAVGLGSETCINCGLCSAKTKDEYLKASQKVRKFLQSEASTRLDQYVIKKIAICGKGGVGKSTVTSMLALSLRDLGYEVLVIDTDESNAGFYRKLGFSTQPKPLLTLLERFSADEDMSNTDWLAADTIKFEDIPEEYMAYENRIGLMMAGKIEDPFQGCACTMSNIIKMLLLKLELSPRQIVIVDNEAGVESFGRGTEQGADTIITVVEPSFESIEMAGRIKYMAEGIGIRRVRAILNKIPDRNIEKLLISKLIEQGVKYLGAIYLDSQVSAASFAGMSSDGTAAKKTMENITCIMLDEAEMNYIKTK